jgi:hypothetical protein
MSNPYRDKLLSIGVIGRRSRPVVTEGREHPETGRAWKRVEDEGSIVTEHNTKNDRVDGVAKVQTIHASLADMKQRKDRANGGQ